MDNPLDFWQTFRLGVIFLGFWTMWCLWQSREARRDTWTNKMRDIWLINFGWTFVCIWGNIEFFYRHVRPTFAISVAIFLLLWTIKTARSNEPYTK